MEYSLIGFDPKVVYPGYEGMDRISGMTHRIQMGSIRNLIADMTSKNAPDADLARAIRHSMVVLDAKKHNLNYKQSYIDNGISQLKLKYKGDSK